MAEKTFIVKLAGDSKSYQDSMSQASKALDKYQKQNLSTDAAVKTLSSTLTKYISIAALAKGAQEALSRTIQGSQTTADKWEATMHACNVVVDKFFNSLSTGDFSAFTMGLANIAEQAKAAANALDNLGNASMSWGYFQSARMADLTELTSVVSDQNRTPAERRAAAQKMKEIRDELQGYASGYEQRALEAMARTLTETTQVSWTNVSREDLERILALDLMPSSFSQQRKDELSAQYQEYVSKVKAMQDNYQKNILQRERVQTGVTQNGLPIFTVVDRTPQEEVAKYQQGLRDLANEYMDVILYQEALVNHSDEWLQNLIQIVQQADNAARSMRRVNSSVQSAENTVNALTGEPVATASKKMGTLPNASGIALIDVSRPTLPDELPETVENLENTDELLTRIASHAENVADGFDRIAAASEGFNSLGRAAEYMGQAMAQSNKKGWQAAGSIVSTVGASVQAYMQLSQAAAQAAAAQAMAETPTTWGKIAAVTMLVTAFANASSQLRAGIQSYAEGNIVPGNNYRDGITARVSSGEMILNEADQRRLFDTIHTGNYGGGGPSVVTGEQILLAVNSYGRRTNRGELVFAGKG